MKQILLIATGGTIASAPTEQGLTPALDEKQLLSYLPDLSSLCQLTGISVMSIDSTNMNPARMGILAQTIAQNYDRYDGFVLAHGTDTMAYSAAALTVMLRHLGKPVVLTGSQIPIEAQDTDAKKNLFDAICFACEAVRGVFVAFDGKIIHGAHATKCRTRSRDAFASINFPVIAHVENGLAAYTLQIQQTAFWHRMHEKIADSFCAQPELCRDVFVLKLFPGMRAEIFDYIRQNFRGVVIESFGIGGIPNEQPDLLGKVQELAQAGLAVVVTTQCMYEGVDLDIYAVGKSLAKQKIIVAGDQTTEFLVMKLMWALAHFDSVDAVKKYMETNGDQK